MKKRFDFLLRRLQRWLYGTRGWRWLYPYADFEIAYREVSVTDDTFEVPPEIMERKRLAHFAHGGRFYIIYDPNRPPEHADSLTEPHRG